MDRGILDQFLVVLESIENGDDDQHSGALKVGKLLKKLYIDSALREARLREEQEQSGDNSSGLVAPLDISYSTYKSTALLAKRAFLHNGYFSPFLKYGRIFPPAFNVTS